jgi:TFIIF-interacting CTD phosphatase-like protein
MRPGLDEFLHLMAQHFEVVIFTASVQDYADWVLNHIDKDNCISY